MTSPSETVFSDDDLKRLKEHMFNEIVLESYISVDFIKALLNRLECAENLAHARHASSKEYIRRLEVWKKAAGE